MHFALLILIVALGVLLLLLLLLGCFNLLCWIGKLIGLLGRGLASLWRTAFPPAPPPPPATTHSEQFMAQLAIAKALQAAHQAKSTPSRPSPPPPEPSRPLPQPSRPGEHFLHVGDILVTVREKNGEFTFETDPPSRRNEAISYLQDEGLMDQIVNKTFRWDDHQPPNG